MVSAYVCPCHGIMRIPGTPAEVAEIMERIGAASDIAVEYLDVGIRRGGYWTATHAAAQLQSTIIPIAKYLHPGAELHFIFDRSQNHLARAPDAVVPTRISLSDNGKRRPMRSTARVSFDGLTSTVTMQNYQYENGTNKGLRRILTERGLYRKGLKVKECRAILMTQPDIIYEQRPHIEHILRNAGCHLIVLPVCHPELNYHIWSFYGCT